MSLKQILWSFGIVLGAFALIVFGLYWWNVGPISSDHTAWSSFGSLLSGVFTIVGAGATVGTLLFLGKQNHDMQEVTKAQMATLTFERYINHRKLFSDQLQELVALHKNAFTFRDPSSLYSAIFPENSPHHCSFTVSPTYDENGDGSNQIGEMLAKLKRLRAYLYQSHFDEEEPQEIILLLIVLAYYIFMIEPTKSAQEGDVRFLKDEYGINIYSLKNFIEPCLSIANMILRFTNNPLIDVREFNSDSRFVREALIKRYHLSKTKHAITVHSDIKGIQMLAFVYFEAQRLREGTNYLFPETVKQLNEKFKSADAVNTLADNSVFNDMLNVLLHEVTHKVYEMDEGLEYYSDAFRVNEHLIALIGRADFQPAP
ncbi:hypothetical protein [Pseudomonas sp. HY13-MNA-CIBAN-0226]|uniref:hypothetical protein n=1 Tax=Pseudomonas sp. HY13-MNA-CIBAN-0226 TaxID=3140473 RepID=UPI00331786A6